VITEPRVKTKIDQPKEKKAGGRKPLKEVAAERPAKTGDEVEVTWVCDLDAKAKEVYVAGDFNDWTLMPMTPQGGKFVAKLRLRRGEYQYKYKVDGKWHTDPAASQVPNAFGTMNSRMRV
jgi:1,4-alpha-glucan branching enzyme